jgi:hypothetical protein
MIVNVLKSSNGMVLDLLDARVAGICSLLHVCVGILFLCFLGCRFMLPSNNLFRFVIAIYLVLSFGQAEVILKLNNSFPRRIKNCSFKSYFVLSSDALPDCILQSTRVQAEILVCLHQQALPVFIPCIILSKGVKTGHLRD